jgi:3-oxo-4-pregnene-20-carboxyl-CoA dehydrogenase alpha subunit
MITELSSEAAEFGRQALRALEAAGGDDLVQRAEVDPSSRSALCDGVLTDLGAWELEPRDDADSLEAAAALCRSAGYWALPYPVAERLARTTDDDGLVVVPEARPAAALAGVDAAWAAVTLDGKRSTVAGLRGVEPAFVTPLELTPLHDNGGDDVALALVLPCWTLLGMLDRALDLTIAHVQSRHQFGQPLAGFQSVQFQLTDGEVERAGLEMLAKHALWRVGTNSPDAVDDALALRTAALEAAEVVFRVTHQLHGAVGFCDETTLSWLSRYSQPLRRLPFGLSATRDALTRRIGRHGLTGLYSGDTAS